MPTDFYFLVVRGTVRPGQLLTGYNDDGEPEIITADPRHLQPSGVLDESNPADVILGKLAHHADESDRAPGCEIARLSPRGKVDTVITFDGDGILTSHPDVLDFQCRQGWCVVEIQPIDGLLGPNAAEIIAAMQIAERVLVDQQQGPQYDAYVDAVNDRLGLAFDDPDEDAAAAALTQHGADGYWWSRCGSCAYGPELTALAARDLIGTTAAWTRDAYDRLTAPWIAAFGEPIHPGDRLRIRSVPRFVALMHFARGLLRRVSGFALAFGPYR